MRVTLILFKLVFSKLQPLNDLIDQQELLIFRVWKGFSVPLLWQLDRFVLGGFDFWGRTQSDSEKDHSVTCLQEFWDGKQEVRRGLRSLQRGFRYFDLLIYYSEYGLLQNTFALFWFDKGILDLLLQFVFHIVFHLTCELK